MPLYFYHIGLELYPSPEPTHPHLSNKEDIWLPPSDTNIFDTHTWPSHPSAYALTSTCPATEGNDTNTRSKAVARVEVTDCKTTRPSTGGGEETTHISVLPRTKLNFGVQTFSKEKAVRDWRFGLVRVEGFDMSPSPLGERAMGPGGHDAMQVGADAVGRVIKARFEELGGETRKDEKGTNVGWGIVHLYRDGEETSAFAKGGQTGVKVYNAVDGGARNDGMGADQWEHGEWAEEDKYTTLCIPAVPSYLTPSDFLGFVGERTREELSHCRMVMTGRMNRYLVLLKFRTGTYARQWRSEWDGKVFNSMEPETCHVVFIKTITFQPPLPSTPSRNSSFPALFHDPFTPSFTSAITAKTHHKAFPPPTPALVELPTCPVCLERMDDTSGLFTIPCQHVFHCACLQKWRGTGCPVCRHTNPLSPLSPSTSLSNQATYELDSIVPPFGSGEASLCTICDSTSDLWICLICGNVGCGRYKGGHAKEHWKESGHNFALEIETQHVWDYADDVWVHRLIRDKGDGKLVELPPLRVEGHGGDTNGETVPRSKLEGMGIEYTHLLTSQLESQRVYFEELVGKAVGKASNASSAAKAAQKSADEATTRFRALEVQCRKFREETVPGLERDVERERRKAEKSSEVARNMTRSVVDEKKVCEGLMGRIQFINAEMERLKEDMQRFHQENESLKEENRDLLFAVTGGARLREMQEEGGELEKGEMEAGTVVLPPGKETRRKGKGKGR